MDGPVPSPDPSEGVYDASTGNNLDNYSKWASRHLVPVEAQIRRQRETAQAGATASDHFVEESGMEVQTTPKGVGIGDDGGGLEMSACYRSGGAPGGAEPRLGRELRAGAPGAGRRRGTFKNGKTIAHAPQPVIEPTKCTEKLPDPCYATP